MRGPSAHQRWLLAKWAALALFALLTAAWIVTVWRSPHYAWARGAFCLDAGTARLYLYTAPRNWTLGWALMYREHQMLWVPSFEVASAGFRGMITVPLWLLAAPAGLCYVIGVLKTQGAGGSDQCSLCGYSLAGLHAGRCPECGVERRCSAG